jgi:preprotein translocase subunit SecG
LPSNCQTRRSIYRRRVYYVKATDDLHTQKAYGRLNPMVFLQEVLPYVQILLSVLIIGAVLLQRTGASLGGAFGSDNFSSGFHTRRGLEKTLFYATIILGILFAISALVNLLIS